jgi:hypothetical protein
MLAMSAGWARRVAGHDRLDYAVDYAAVIG